MRAALPCSEHAQCPWGCSLQCVVMMSQCSLPGQELDLKVRQFEALLHAPPPLAAAPNVAALWARIMVEELCRLGANTFCIAPGDSLSL